MAVIELIDHTTFAAAPGLSILDAAQAAGLVLAHSCRTGRCGSCRIQVLAGQTRALLAETGLTAEDSNAGWILSCARAATTDLRLSAADLGALAHIRSATWPCRIDALHWLAPEVMRVVLRLPPQARWVHLSGQYLTLIARDGLRRSYSMANAGATADAPQGRVVLHIRRVEGGALSRYWFEQARAGDLLRVQGPLGTFFLRDGAGRDLVFLATGTGMAPILAMLQDLDKLPAARRPRSVTLLWGGRQPQDLYLVPEHPGLRYLPVLSRADASWPGARGHVQQVLLQTPRDWANTVVYACGSAAMVQSARSGLVAAGLPAGQFHADAFVSSGAAGLVPDARTTGADTDQLQMEATS